MSEHGDGDQHPYRQQKHDKQHRLLHNFSPSSNQKTRSGRLSRYRAQAADPVVFPRYRYRDTELVGLIVFARGDCRS
jgi:hypothetical protein